MAETVPERSREGPEVAAIGLGRVRLEVSEGIDYFLPAGRIRKRKLPPVSIRRVLPFSKPVCPRGLKIAMKPAQKVSPPTQGPETDGRPRSARPKRADARRNQERLVAAAREVFAESGAGAAMEAIARKAGVGVGTLYRNFPQRIDLVEAVYSTDVRELSEAAKTAVADARAVAGGGGLLRGVRALRPDQADAAGRAAAGIREEPGAALAFA